MKLIYKILLGIVGVVVIFAISAWIYFGSGSETYPNGLTTGQIAPDFVALDQFGNSQSLADLRAEGDVVLIFFRGTWCPMCNQHIAALQDSLLQINSKGAKVVAITPEKPEFKGENDIKTSIEIPVLYDEGMNITGRYNVAYDLSLGNKRIFSAGGVNFEELYDSPGKMPLPATFVIDSTGMIKYSNVSEGGLKIQYASVKDLLAVL